MKCNAAYWEDLVIQGSITIADNIDEIDGLDPGDTETKQDLLALCLVTATAMVAFSNLAVAAAIDAQEG